MSGNDSRVHARPARGCQRCVLAPFAAVSNPHPLSFSAFACLLSILPPDSRLPHANHPAERCDREVRNLGYGRPGACEMGAQTDHDARASAGDERRAGLDERLLGSGWVPVRAMCARTQMASSCACWRSRTQLLHSSHICRALILRSVRWFAGARGIDLLAAGAVSFSRTDVL